MNGKKIAIVVMAGALIFSLERLIAQRSMVFEVGATPVAMCAIAVPLASFESVQLQEFANGVKVTSVRAGYRQVIDLSGDCSRESVQIV
jgi:hypothetical protein